MTGDSGEFWNDVRKDRQKKNRERYERNVTEMQTLVNRENVAFLAHDNGSYFRAHLTGTMFNDEVDWWPSTGTARHVGTNEVQKALTARGVWSWLRKINEERWTAAHKSMEKL